MPGFPRQPDRQVPVDELLLRRAGDDAESQTEVGHRLRLERQAQEAASQAQRVGLNLQRITAGVAAALVIGCLVLLALLSTAGSTKQTALPFASLEPAIPDPSATTLVGTAPAPQPSAKQPPAATMVASPSTSATPTTADTSTAPLPPPGPSRPPLPSAACSVRYSIRTSWPGGFTADLTIANNGDATLSPWSLSWTFTAGQRVTEGWNGTYSQSGGRVFVSPASYNTTIAPFGTVDIGFNGSFGGSNPRPTGFSLNGTPCTLA